MLRDPLHGVLVDALEEHRCRLATADREVEQRVAAGMPEHRLELTRVQLDGLRRVTMAVDDGGEDPLSAQAADGLADDLARLCRHDRTSAHGREPLSGWRDLRLRCGASLTARGRDLRDRLTCLGRCGW